MTWSPDPSPLWTYPPTQFVKHLIFNVMDKGTAPPIKWLSVLHSINQPKSQSTCIESWGNLGRIMKMLCILMGAKSTVAGVIEEVELQHLTQGLEQRKFFMEKCKSVPSWLLLWEILTNWRDEGPTKRKELLLTKLSSPICLSLFPLSSLALLWWRHNWFSSQESTPPTSWNILGTSSP